MSEVQLSERQEMTDPETGRRVIQWTTSPTKDQHPYFTSHSVTADGRRLLIISERSGAPNFHVIDRAEGTMRQLSHADALLRAYCHPQGTLRGFSKATAYLDPQRQYAYWVQDDVAWRISLEPGSEAEKLAELPAGWYTGFTHVSPDGRTFCVPCADPRAFRDDDQTQSDQTTNVPWRMLEQGLVTRLCMIDTERCEIRDEIELPFWVTHVQFDPKGSGRMVFNCEGKVGAGADREFPYWGRIWGLEPDGRWHRLYEQPVGEYLNHENWTPSGDAIVYHGRRDGEQFIAARTWDGELVFDHPAGAVSVHHAVSSPFPHRFTVDSHDGYVYLFDFEKQQAEPAQRLCSHSTSFSEQDAHAHPIMNPTGDGVVFTSDRAGVCNVYEVVME